jgi:hypothetical protein
LAIFAKKMVYTVEESAFILRCEDLMAVKIWVWFMTLCRLVGDYQNFGGTFCLHLQEVAI